MTNRSVDLNADLGEGFGAYTIGDDEALMALVSSVNIACGFHAGDSSTMRRATAAAAAHGLSIGAHPGLPDLQGFGRRRMALDASDIHDIVLHQIGALAGFAQAAGSKLSHVKPHGALYNMAEESGEAACAIAEAVRDFDSSLLVYALSGGLLAREAERLALRAVHEVFADRGYQASGKLIPRGRPGDLLHDADEAAERMLALIQTRSIDISGTRLALRADTVCVHGDGPEAVCMAHRLRHLLIEAGVSVASPVQKQA